MFLLGDLYCKEKTYFICYISYVIFHITRISPSKTAIVKNGTAYRHIYTHSICEPWVNSNNYGVKGLVHPKMKIKSLITHPHAVPTP